MTTQEIKSWPTDDILAEALNTDAAVRMYRADRFRDPEEKQRCEDCEAYLADLKAELTARGVA